MVGEYSYDLDGEVELEDVMEKVTCLLNWEFKGTVQWNLSKLKADTIGTTENREGVLWSFSQVLASSNSLYFYIHSLLYL